MRPKSIPTCEIVSQTVEGGLHRYGYAQARERIGRLANALVGLGIKPGDRVATLAWNGYRHFELYYAIAGIGAVCHTINPRLFPEQITYIANHAEDTALFFDLTFLPLVEKLKPALKTIKTYALMTDREHMPANGQLAGLLCYEGLLAEMSPDFEWPEFDENAACALCYTSGTTGEPKGVLYSNRSMLLHTFFLIATRPDLFAHNRTILPVVPLFHANAWSLPYITPLTGCPFILPGAKLDGADALRPDGERGRGGRLGRAHRLARPARGVQEARAQAQEARADPERRLGRAAGHDRHLHARLRHRGHARLGHDRDEPGRHADPVPPRGARQAAAWSAPQLSRQAGPAHVRRRPQGHRREGQPRARRTAQTSGELFVRGATVVSGYFNNQEASAKQIDGEGWFGTGDVAKITPDDWLLIVDRTKDLVKSGGEWISSIDVENAALACKGVANCAVIGVPHPKWNERPLLVVVKAPGAKPTKAEILDVLGAKIAKWQMPDDVVFVDALPMTATGKISKKDLRAKFADHKLPA